MDDKVKELLDRIRDTASAAADTAADTARVAGRKAGQMVDVAKLNVQLFDLNGEFYGHSEKAGTGDVRHPQGPGRREYRRGRPSGARRTRSRKRSER